MSSKVAISADDIKRVFTAANPTHAGLRTPDFKLKRFEEAASAFGHASLCQGDPWDIASEQG
jgi:hypothetical protein